MRDQFESPLIKRYASKEMSFILFHLLNCIKHPPLPW